MFKKKSISIKQVWPIAAFIIVLFIIWNTNTLFKYIDTLKISKTIKPINLSLFSDYNPKTTTHGLGFKNKEKALYTVDTIKNRPIKYQVNVIATMLGRAKKHPHKTKEMNDAIKVFSKWMSNYKESSKK